MKKNKKISNKFVHVHVIDRLAFLNGILSGVALYPQAFKVLFSHSSTDVSFLSIALIFINSFVWVFYAVHRGLISLGISSILNMLAATILLVALFYAS